MDFSLDWETSLELMFHALCHNQVFGIMMFITIFFLPCFYAMLKPNDDERKFWERIFRTVFFMQKINPYEKWAPSDDIKLYWLTLVFYILFSPFTHVVSQIKE
jgi:hypothetical protein